MSRFFCLWLPFVEGQVKGQQSGVAPRDALSPVQGQAPCSAFLWNETLECLHDFTPFIESLRPGLALADLGPIEAMMLLREVGSKGVVAHGGAACDRASAILAARTAIAGTLRSVRPGRGEGLFHAVPLDALSLCGVDEETLRALKRRDCATLSDAYALLRDPQVSERSDTLLQDPALRRVLEASDTRPVALWVPPCRLSERDEFEEPPISAGACKPALNALLARVCSQLRGRTPGALKLSVETSCGQAARRCALPAGAEPFKAARQAALCALPSLAPVGVPICAIEVALLDLSEPEVSVSESSTFVPSRSRFGALALGGAR